jgi:hypothetical protein
MPAVESAFDIHCVLILLLCRSSGGQVALNQLVYAVGVEKVLRSLLNAVTNLIK